MAKSSPLHGYKENQAERQHSRQKALVVTWTADLSGLALRP